MHRTPMPVLNFLPNPKKESHFLIGTTNMGQTNLKMSSHLNRDIYSTKTNWQILALYPATYKAKRSEIYEKQREETEKLRKKYTGCKIHIIKEE